MSSAMPARVQVGRFFRTVLPAALLLLGAVLAGLGIVVFRLTHPGAVPELVTPSTYLLPSTDASWSAGSVALSGWWIPGTKGAPAIVLVPGILINRSDPLSLAASLHQKGYGVLTFDLRGGGAAPKHPNSLGLKETEDVLSAIEFARTRPGVDADRIGIWGVDAGAWAAFIAAAQRPEVRAIAADSVFESVADYVRIRLTEDLGNASRYLDQGSLWLFQAYMLASSEAVSRRVPTEQLADRSILFIQGENRRALAGTTEGLYMRFLPRKEMLTLPLSRGRVMSGEEMTSYDRQVTNFFSLNLPVGRVAERGGKS
jgi:uncharacterized protein